MSSENENRLRSHLELLKQELRLEDFIHRFVEIGIITGVERDDILNCLPKARVEKFLQILLQGGDRVYHDFCNILTDKNNAQKYQMVIKALELPTGRKSSTGAAISDAGRSVTGLSALSLESGNSSNDNGENGQPFCGSARSVWRTGPLPREDSGSANNDNDKSIAECRPTTPAEAVHMAVAKATLASHLENGDDPKAGGLNMETLEQELVRIAPTIADLFNKISSQNSTVVAATEEELKQIKDDNERLRKTNRSLVEKLNSFQQKIIQLQLENKKLKDESVSEKKKQDELKQRADELEGLKDRLEEQKRALEEKEHELDIQMQKIADVISDNEKQKEQLDHLEQLQEEGLREFDLQQEQITTLMEEKEKQKEQIEDLEAKQRYGEQLLYRLEERLLLLERGGGAAHRNRQRSQFGLSMSRPWMNGMVERSHHAKVKFQVQPQFPSDNFGPNKGGKGWNF